MRMRNYIRMYVRTLYLPRVRFHHFGCFVFSCDLHVPLPVGTPLAFQPSTCDLNWFSTTPRSFVKVCCVPPPDDLDLQKPRLSKTLVMCGPRVKVTCIWHRVTMLALCFRNKPRSTRRAPLLFRQSLHFLATHHAALHWPRVSISIHASRASTLIWDNQIRCFSALPPHHRKKIASSSDHGLANRQTFLPPDTTLTRM